MSPPLPVGRILFPDDVSGGVLNEPVAYAVVEKAVVVEFPFALVQNLDAALFVVMAIASLVNFVFVIHVPTKVFHTRSPSIV